jgi:predicted dehydrogenase
VDTVRYGIIGTGMMGFEHIRNLRLLPGARVTALADPHEPSRRLGLAACGEDAKDVEVYADPRELLARAPVDAVVVASPNHTHAALLAEVFRTAKHVLVEKPLCTTLDDCRRVVDAAE